MIKSVEFKNFRNLNGIYNFDNRLNVIIGKNNSGKTNILDGIKLAFSTITNDYFKISVSNFKDSIESNMIEIKIELEYDVIPSLDFIDGNKEKCGFTVKIRRETIKYTEVKEIADIIGCDLTWKKK